MTATVPAPERAHDGLSRRRILQGAAWAAPAIVLASAAPAFAVGSGDASTSTPVASGTFTAALKNPGATQKAGSLVVTRQDTGSTIPFVITSITIAFTSTQQNQGTQGGISTAGWEVDADASTFPVPGNLAGTMVIVPTSGGYSLSGSDAITLAWSLSRYESIDSVTLVGTAGAGGVELPGVSLSRE